MGDVTSNESKEIIISPSYLKEGYESQMMTINTSLSTTRELGTISVTLGDDVCSDVQIIQEKPLSLTCIIPAGIGNGWLVNNYEWKVAAEVSLPRLGLTYRSILTIDKRRTITFNVNDEEYGSLKIERFNSNFELEDDNQSFLALPYREDYYLEEWIDGKYVSVSKVLTPIPADQTAQYTYAFIGFTTTCGEKIIADCAVTANFSRTLRSYTIEFSVNNAQYGSISANSVTKNYGQSIIIEDQTIKIDNETALIATPASATTYYIYSLESWTSSCGDTITGDCMITANFTMEDRLYDITIKFADQNVESVVFMHPENNDEIITITESGAIARIKPAVYYTIAMTAAPGYEFASWSKTNGAIGSTSLNPTTFRVTSNSTLTVTTKEACTGYLSGTTCINYMQEVTPAVCNALILETQYQFKDSRDSKYYWVAKLADGNCWMTQNLDYNINAESNIISNNDGTTSIWDATSDYAPRATQTEAFAVDFAENLETYSYDRGDYYWSEETGEEQLATTLTDFSAVGDENLHYHVGNLYQYNALAAGTASIITTSDYTEVPSSICPAGWRLPTSKSTSENLSFKKLLTSYSVAEAIDNTSGQILFSSPFYFVRGGNLHANGLYGQGTSASLPSSIGFTQTGETVDVLGISVTNNYTDSMISNYSVYGTPARCIVNKPQLENITTMQQMTPNIVESTPENQSKQLLDIRDNKYYWVSKLKDGSIWMTQNLDYDINAESNIVANLDGTTSTWDATSTYAPEATTTSAYSTSDNVGTKSFDGGDYYMPNGISDKVASVPLTSQNAIGDETLHYHLGNYYQFNAATAGTGGTYTNRDTASSICPQGWRLPTSNSTVNKYSFGKLTTAYGYTSSNTGTTNENMRSAPLYFPRSGYYNNVITDLKTNVLYWSGRAYSNTSRSFALYFYSKNISPSVNRVRSVSLNVRCVAI